MTATEELRRLLDKALGEQDDAIRLAREVAYSTGYEAGFDEGLASTDGWSADDWTGQHEDAMAEHGWVKLPVDADGVPIRVGDVMEERSGHTFEVASLMAFGGSDNWLVLSDARNFSSFREPHDLRHYHEPTVEDVLRELLSKYDELRLGPSAFDPFELMAEYAAKLRLAGDE